MRTTHEIKHITTEEYLNMFPNIKLTKLAKKEFKETTELTTIIRLKGRKKFKPVFRNEIGAYYLINDREIYFLNL
jgi:hypothetical protein